MKEGEEKYAIQYPKLPQFAGRDFYLSLDPINREATLEGATLFDTPEKAEGYFYGFGWCPDYEHGMARIVEVAVVRQVVRILP
jgi:hypothetical protein